MRPIARVLAKEILGIGSGFASVALFVFLLALLMSFCIYMPEDPKDVDHAKFGLATIVLAGCLFLVYIFVAAVIDSKGLYELNLGKRNFAWMATKLRFPKVMPMQIYDMSSPPWENYIQDHQQSFIEQEGYRIIATYQYVTWLLVPGGFLCFYERINISAQKIVKE